MVQSAQRATTIVQTDLVRKARPRKSVDFQDVVEKLDQLKGPAPNFRDSRGLFHAGEVMTDMMAASPMAQKLHESIQTLYG